MRRSICLAVILLFAGCADIADYATPTPSVSTSTPAVVDTYIPTEAPVETDNEYTDYTYEEISGYDHYKADILEQTGLSWLLISEPDPDAEKGLEITGIVTRQVEHGLLSEGAEATVILFEIMVGSVLNYPVLMIDGGEENIYKLLTEPLGAYSSDIYLCDIDGNGYSEIVTHHNTGGNGGAGSYVSFVYKFDGNALTPLFDTFDEWLDTGFNLLLDDGFQYTITNTYTQFDTTFTREYYGTPFFDDDGNMLDLAKSHNEDMKLARDTFYIFEPIDYDGDGVFEIMTAQYSFLWSHADGVGTAYTILKYDNQSGDMAVIKAGFWQYLDVPDEQEESYYEQWDYYLQNWYKE